MRVSAQARETADVPFPERVRAFLAEPRFAAIATVDPDGSPHQALVWYLLKGDELVINSRRQRRWPRNLMRDERISVAVQDWSDPEHWIGLKGRAELLHQGDDALGDIMAMARRYGSNPDQYRGQDRVSFAVRATRLFEYGAD